jgi:hypothetical protein
MSVNVEGYRNESFESLEAAVMETPRGRWFLDEYAKRQRSAESQAILDILRSLEKSILPISHNAEPPKPLNQEQLKFFKKDEDLFVEPTLAPAPTLTVISPTPVVEVKQPQEPKGARLKIQRINASDLSEEPAIGEAELKIPEIVPVEQEKDMSVPPAPTAEPKQRIVIIRRPASEVAEIPMVDEKKTEVAA